jgi:hypothetical protein
MSPLVLIVATGLLLAACGGGTSPSGVANIGTTTTTLSVPTSINAKLDKYGACMRAHGLPTYPNPIVSGNSISQLVQPGPTYTAAAADCRSLLPTALQPPSHSITAAQQVYYLKAVACMRQHGVANFPDPTFANGDVHFTVPPSINQNAPLYVKALATCRKLIPAGLPYSN